MSSNKVKLKDGMRVDFIIFDRVDGRRTIRQMPDGWKVFDDNGQQTNSGEECILSWLDDGTYRPVPQPVEISSGGIIRAANPVASSSSEAAARKAKPLATGCIDYFPDALLAVAELSRIGNDQHSPGQPLHWDRGKSTDESDALMRHFLDRGARDTDGVRHSAKVAWRALALLQKEIEQDLAKKPCRIDTPKTDCA